MIKFTIFYSFTNNIDLLKNNLFKYDFMKMPKEMRCLKYSKCRMRKRKNTKPNSFYVIL